MKVDTSRVGLVRGVLIFSQWRAGCIGIEEAKDENNVRVNVAYTPWHRHDEDPAIVERELDRLYRCYSSFRSYEGCTMYFEYRPYNEF